MLTGNERVITYIIYIMQTFIYYYYYRLIREKMSNKKTTEKEIKRIDSILNKLDELMKQLPDDYQMDYAQEVLDRFTD